MEIMAKKIVKKMTAATTVDVQGLLEQMAALQAQMKQISGGSSGGLETVTTYAPTSAVSKGMARNRQTREELVKSLKGFDPEISMSAFGKAVRIKREARQLTQEQLAELVGLSRQAFNQIENGKRKYLRFDHVLTLSRLLGINLDSLLTYGESVALAKERSKEAESLLNRLGEEAAGLVKGTKPQRSSKLT
jgi:transcriptional regulator with XRE-family HTH domain